MITERTILKIAEEYSRRLGIPCPEVVTQRGKSAASASWHPRDSRSALGRCYHDHISINRYDLRTLGAVKHTVGHEVIHRAFPNLSHGPNFDRYINALMSGEMFFRGSMRYTGIGFRTEIQDGQKVAVSDSSIKVFEKVDLLDTVVPKQPVPVNAKIESARTKVREIDAKIKRFQNLRNKWSRRLRRLEKRT